MTHQIPNPYQPPAETPGSAIVAETDWTAQTDGQISFEVALTERDVKRFFPSPLPIGVFVVIVALLLLLFTMSTITRTMLVFAAGFIGLLVLLRTRFNWRMALRQSPRLLEVVAGYINAEGIFISSDGCRGYSRWEDIHAIRMTKKCALISGENWRLVSSILPWTSFSDPDAARQAFSSVVEQRKSWRPIAIGDPRLRETPSDVAMFDPSSPHVSFDGEITFGAIAASAPGKKLKRTVRRWVPVTAALLIVAALSIMGGMIAALLIGFPLAVFAITMIVLLSRHPLVRGGDDKVAFRTRGWFCQSGFFLQSVTGQSLRQWRSVDHQWHDDSLLCICLPGISEGWFFFSREQFANGEDYQQACRWAQAGLGESSPSSPNSV